MVYDKVEYLCVNYVEDILDSQAEELEEDLLEIFRNYGAETSVSEGDDGIIRKVVFSDAFKKNWFSNRFNRLKKAVDELTLNEFACKNQYSLSSLIDNDYCDTVYSDTLYRSMDSFIRDAETGIPYYIYGCVLMH